jgi:hypothetical protein
MTKHLIIYHGSCLDGFTAAWACWRLYVNRGADYFPAHYEGGGADVVLPDVTGRDVVMVDFCTGREQLLRLKAEAASFRVLDHHVTAQAVCEGLDFCTFDMERSGAGLAWDYLHADRQRPWLIDYAEDRDLWRFKLPRSKAVNAFISAQPMTFERWEQMSELTPEQAADRGEAVLSFVDRYVTEMAKQARRMTFAGHQDIPVVNAPYINTSELVGHLASQDGVPFAVGWSVGHDGAVSYSLRSRGDFDVSALAQRFGGGGHKAAAGFKGKLQPHELGLGEDPKPLTERGL